MSYLVNSPLADILIWVQEFDFIKGSIEPADLSDGLIIADILNSLSPNDFSENWKATIHDITALDSRKKVINLDRIVGAISNFFAEVIDQPLSISQLPDVSLIAELNDESELFRLLQLVLCCAVNCQDKEIHIQSILNMEQSVQHSIMEAIQNIMSETERNSNKTRMVTRKVATHSCAERCQELEAKILQLESEKSLLESEAEEMMHQLSSVEKNRSTELSLDSDDLHSSPIPASEPGSIAIKLQLRQLQHKLSCVLDELYHSEAEHQETKVRLSETLNAFEDMKSVHEDLIRKAEEAKQLKDDLDIARDEVLNARRSLASFEQWKKRADEVTALRLRCSKLEADNVACLEMVTKLEKENRMSSSLRSQIESNRQQSLEAQARSSELLVRAERAESLLNKIQSELDEAIRDKQVITNEFNRLRDQCDKRSSVVSGAVVDTSSNTRHFDVSETQHELSNNLDSINLGIDEHRCNLSKHYTHHSTENDVPIASSSQLVTTSTDADGSTNLERVMAMKNEELFQMEQQYRGYLSKTLEIIRCLDRRNNNVENLPISAEHNQTDPEIVRLQNLLVEKENIIEKLENHYSHERRQRDLEERMVLTAWYHLGMRIKREEMMSRLHLQSESQDISTLTLPSDDPLSYNESFLAGQRRLHLRSTPFQTRIGFGGP